MNIKICLPPRKRPMTLDDLPDMRAVVPVGWWQQVIVFDKPEWTSGAIKNVPSKQYGNFADRMRLESGWGEWRIGKDFATNLAKFEIEAPWTLEEVKGVRGRFRSVVFDLGSTGFCAEDAFFAVSGCTTVGEALVRCEDYESYPRLIINQETRARVLEVTP